MMATLLSSPLAPAPAFDLFEQPSSPKHYNNHDLPADFDKSFGSSMSISDSFDGHQSQPYPAFTLQSQPFTFGGSLGLAHSLVSSADKQHASQFLTTEPFKQQHQPSRPSPRHANSLGAAMGTTLNALSPGLAANMSSPKDMDISPAPGAPITLAGPSPAETLPKLMNSIHVGQPCIAGPSTDRLHPVLGGSSRPRPIAAQRKSSLQLAHTMSSRLFGAEIALNSQMIFARDQQLLSSPDKEPPPKRRPNSLPVRQSANNERVSQLTAALMGVTSSRTRSSLSAPLDQRDPAFHAAASSSRSGSSFSVRNRLSDSGLPLGMRSSKRASRASSAESFFEDNEDELSARHTLLADDQQNNVGLWHETSLVSEPQDEEDAEGGPDDSQEMNPSPSPSMGSVSGAMAGFFNNPLSPEKLGARLGMTPVERPNLLAAMSSTANSPSASSPPASSPCTRMPPPKRTTSLGPRAFERARTVAVVPRMAACSASSCAAGSAAGPLRTTLGKRANPYVKRPSLINENPAIKSAYPVLGVSGQANRVVRPTATAPRRCFSAFDHSAVLGKAASSKLGSNLVLSPASPDRRRTHPSSEVTDANGSPIAPSMRTRVRPNYMRKESKDDSSPLAYGTGMRHSGSRGKDAMVDDLALDDPAYVGSPAGAESFPGFGTSEKEGKVLPCFNVKDDGLMRITAQTLTDLLVGKYTNAIMSYEVIDCRFGYEYQGGHIPGAINLSTVDKVLGHFLTPGQGRHANETLPPRSQSGKADKFGNRRKHVLVFHCEFSCQRAPTMAKALRSQDRALAARDQDYLNCHFPDIYILEGGYSNFFSKYANLCEPQQYICMDDPRFLGQRNTELHGFRKQKFLRQRSFTYGEGQKRSLSSQVGVGKAKSKGKERLSIQEEVGMDESPCPTGAGMELLTVPSRHSREDVGKAADQAEADTSIGSVGDSSFEGGFGDSPCAAAGSRILLQPRMGSLNLGRRPLLRAGTMADVLPRYKS